MSSNDVFKEDFKYYKRKNYISNLDNVIDFERHSKFNDVIDVREAYLRFLPDHCFMCETLNLQPHQSWELYAIKGMDGFIFIKNPFSVTGQQNWIQKCLEKYPCKPSITNLDLHYPNVDNIWSLLNDADPEKRSYIQKLCWATLGYHHNWDTKVYDANYKSDVPLCLQKLSTHIAQCLGFSAFKPEAAIVNYYNLKSSLGVHNDHSEEDFESPIVSISFGQTGLFMIGTDKKCDKPHALFLRSGDIVVMSGACRLSYHAVPCILSEDVEKRYVDGHNDSWTPFLDHINKSRINISVRKVYKS